MKVFQEVESAAIPEGLITVMRGLPIEDEAALEKAIAEFKAAHGYEVHDIVAITPETPDEALDKFDPPHTHSEDEIRLFLEGEGIFDLMTDDGRWFRVLLQAGDMIVVPAGRVHRFEPTFRKSLRCVRIFKDPAGWVPEYVAIAR